MKASRRNPFLLTPETLNSPLAEAYRTLRANINFRSLEEPIKTILVTSARAGEGKSTTALNLGIIIGQAGPRVLVVDADFRHPSLYEMTGLASSRHPVSGLSDLIAGSPLGDAVLPSGYSKVGIVPAGKVPANPGEVLSSRRMQAVLDELSGQADFVLLDGPPCLQYAEAYHLARMADGILYVVRAGAQDNATQRRVQRQLQQAKARMLGVVLNAVDPAEVDGQVPYARPPGRRR
jgi:capsular exopolysaccharide synthesis family protein